jgi:hypothetical protein
LPVTGTGVCTQSASLTSRDLLFPHSGDRIPAIISVVSTSVAGIAVFLNWALQISKGVSDVTTGVAGLGPDFGGVGGGMYGLDAGLWQVLDAGQFVVMASQLNGTTTPWVVKYFAEYFTPFIGLLPLGSEGLMSFSSQQTTNSLVVLDPAMPRPVAAVLQVAILLSFT